MGLQIGATLWPADAEVLSKTVALVRQDGTLMFVNASGPIFVCDEDDREAVRLAAAMLSQPEFGIETQTLADALDLHRTTVWRYRKRYEAQGTQGIRGEKKGPKGPHKLQGIRLAQAQRYLNQGLPNTEVAERVGVTEGTIRAALGAGRLRHTGKELGESKGPRARSDADRRTKGGVAVKRNAERALARGGALEEAPPRFVEAPSVQKAGVLVALPALIAQGLFEVGEAVYGKLGNGFYGLRSLLATFAFMALLRLRSVEQISSHSPGEFGLILGLDRVPEKKTLRRKLAELGHRQKGLELIEAFARRWAEEQPNLLGLLYVDGHVRPYHGRAHTLPKTWVPRRRLAMPATTDFWVNDAFGDPLFFVTAPANDGMLAMLDAEILPEIRTLVEPERRIMVVLDREGWSPKRFRRWWEEGFDVLTYRKGSYEPWPEERFTEVEARVCGNPVTYRLAEDRLVLAGGFEVREVRSLDEDADHQVSIITTQWELPAVEVAVRMFGRWRQENFFRYMRHEFALDHLPTLAVEPADPTRPVPNPVRKEKEKKLTRLTAELGRLHRAIGEAALGGSNGNGTREEPAPIAPDLIGKVSELEQRIASQKEERDALPKRVPLDALMDESDIVRLEQERKRIHDVIKMVAYRAETELASLVGPFLGPHHQDEARSFLRQVFELPADLQPDEQAQRLVVRLHGMADWRSNHALAGLCAILNEYQSTYPGTSLRLVLEPPALQK